jgi:hypothetical protein
MSQVARRHELQSLHEVVPRSLERLSDDSVYFCQDLVTLSCLSLFALT